MPQSTRDFILTCWTVFWIWWLVSAVSVKRTVEFQSKGWSLRFAVIALALFFLMRDVPSVAAVASVRLLPETPSVGIIADILAFVGLAIMLWARIVIGRDWSGGVVLKEDHELAVTGPYAYVRHPIYTGLLTLMLGTAVAWGAAAGFVFFAAFTAVFVYKSRVEERFMTKHFPEKYPAYMKRVKALIPWVF